MRIPKSLSVRTRKGTGIGRSREIKNLSGFEIPARARVIMGWGGKPEGEEGLGVGDRDDVTAGDISTGDDIIAGDVINGEVTAGDVTAADVTRGDVMAVGGCCLVRFIKKGERLKSFGGAWLEGVGVGDPGGETKVLAEEREAKGKTDSSNRTCREKIMRFESRAKHRKPR